MKRMDIKRNRYITFKQTSIIVGLLSLTILLAAGCLATYGKAVKSDEATTAFNQFKYMDGHTYYYLGFESNPYAILALDTQYALDDDIWKAMDPDLHDLEKMVTKMNRSPSCSGEGKRGTSGYSVVDENDVGIGQIYACYGWFPVRTVSENRVTITCPDMYNNRPDYSDS